MLFASAAGAVGVNQREEPVEIPRRESELGGSPMRHRYFVTIVKGVRAFVVVAAAGVLASQAFAQAPKAQPKAPVPKAQPKGGEAPQQQPQGEQPKLSFSPWTKVC